GMADPQALSMVVNAARAYDYVGMPEGRFHLSQACIYLATAEKSNSGFAFFDALRTVQSETKDEVPNHLKDASRDKKGLGHGKDYQYPHAFKDHWAAQQYLPESLQGKYFYNPSSQGYESKIKQRVERLRQELLAGSLESGEFFELTANEFWKQRSLGDFREQENQIMEYLFGQLKFNREELVLNLNAGSGLFFGELVRLLPLATLYGGVYQPKEKELLEKTLGLSNLKGDFNLFHIDTSVELNSFSAIPPQTAFDHIIGKNALKPLSDKSEYIALLKKYLSREGILALAETIPKQGQRLSRYVQLFEIKMDQGLLNDWIKLEELMFEKENNPLLSWDDQSLEKDLQQAGFDILLKEKTSLSSQLFMPKSKISRWFGTKEKPSYYGNFLSETLRPKQTETIRELLLNSIGDRVLPWTQTWLFIKAQIQKSEQFSETKPLNES
ncbi:MAG: hypothetical protein OEY59_12315, partial [Deltaproteobacteria bacterium]|nr:hypothetical protein [Deltaproteobacteria bacterium]